VFEQKKNVLPKRGTEGVKELRFLMSANASNLFTKTGPQQPVHPTEVSEFMITKK